MASAELIKKSPQAAEKDQEIQKTAAAHTYLQIIRRIFRISRFLFMLMIIFISAIS